LAAIENGRHLENFENAELPKVFSFVERGLKSYFEGFKGGGVYYRILWES
jgi:hypothetical protein